MKEALFLSILIAIQLRQTKPQHHEKSCFTKHEDKLFPLANCRFTSPTDMYGLRKYKNSQETTARYYVTYDAIVPFDILSKHKS